jgi:hypothetical protein
MTAQQFRRRAGEVEAMQWSGNAEDAQPIVQWVHDIGGYTAVWREYRPYSSGGLFPQMAQDRIDEGIYVRRDKTWRDEFVGPGDYLMLLDGEFRACKQKAFDEIYEPND